MTLIEGIAGIERSGRSLNIGAMTCHSEVATSPVVAQAIPALAGLAGMIGDPAVRHRGTIGGSVANNDPNADYPAACLGLGATIVTNKRRDQRRRVLHRHVLDRARAHRDHRKVSSRFRRRRPTRNSATRLHASRWSACSCRSTAAEIRVAVTGAGRTACSGCRLRRGAEEALLAEVARGPVHSGDRHETDIHGSAEYRAHLVGVLARRAVAEAIGDK